jgi:hypothetical protein
VIAKTIAVRLRRRWNAADAEVLADWCETHELRGTAKALRLGATAKTQMLIKELCRAMGVRESEWPPFATWSGRY